MTSFTTARFALLTATALAACGHGGHDAHDHAHAEHEHAAPADEALAGDVFAQLELDDGKRWPMDDHTRSMFASMVESFSALDDASPGEERLRKAGADLQKDVTELLRGCTMSGAAHDQLHIYLTGYMSAIEVLARYGRAEDAARVKLYLERYDEFFE